MNPTHTGMNPPPDPSWQEALDRGRPIDRAGWSALRDRLPADEARRMAVDAALNEALAALPEAPRVSTNFGSRVGAAIRLAAAADQRPARHPVFARPAWLGWAFGLAALVLALGLWQGRESGRRETLARAVAEVSRTARSTGIEVDAFAQFEVIRGLDIQATPADDALVAALSQ